MKDCIVAVLVGRRDHRPGMPVSGVAAGRPSTADPWGWVSGPLLVSCTNFSSLSACQA